MLQAVKQIIFAIAPYALIPPLVLSIARFRQFPTALRLLSMHIWIAAVTELLANLLWHWHVNNLFLLHIYTVEECGLLLWFYSYLLNAVFKRTVFLYVFAGFLVGAVLNSVFIQHLSQNNTYTRSVEAILIIVCAVAYFYRMLSETMLSQPARSPYFWINTGLLIYFAASLLLFTMSNYIRGPQYKHLRQDIWTLHAFFTIVLYCFISIGLWKQPKK